MSVRYNEGEMPNQFEDEDLWFKFFKKKQLLIIASILFICLALIRWFSSVNLMWVGVVIAIVIMIVALVLVMIPIPDNLYLYGIGKPLYVMVVLFLLNKINPKKHIYTLESDKEK